ncbi:hypothetical protein PL263_19690 [Methylomonas sp. EFPC3]|uniref:hypothetical protein n=1 Tax=Methylomonas sp. EFPC3 TaxID=3021710 RepID=UPI0024160E52|nr:hypothetical protein [Methylomonas sp. EFPC3]WFP50301.1 hypothetical protein PL263_19690 [Methylomonas sp. EFPC3]
MSKNYLLEDRRTNCLSCIYTTTVNEYLTLVESVYSDRGGLAGQRAPLKTKTGIRIRNRMVNDIKVGAILPPMVIGAVLTESQFSTAKNIQSDEDMSDFINKVNKDDLSIIDGMQRTTAILEANKDGQISSHPIRIEIWLSSHIDELIYRMLVLNTGQVPWDMKRQLETIYKPILTEIEKEVPNINILFIDEKERRNRTDAGQYLSERLIEYFLAFSSRKTDVDIKERVAEDFARMDATEATASKSFLPRFISSLKNMAKLDEAFTKLTSSANSIGERFESGRDIFASAPAGIGFIAAASVYIFGPPGFSYDDNDADNKTNTLSTNIENLVNVLNQKNLAELDSFLELSFLNEKLSRRSGKIGEFERDFFFKAFSTLFSYADRLTSMEPCWAAK